jgi:hypothetical protein
MGIKVGKVSLMFSDGWVLRICLPSSAKMQYLQNWGEGGNDVIRCHRNTPF